MNPTELSRLLRTVIDDAIGRLQAAETLDRRAIGERPDQYQLDLVVDQPMVESLLAAGLGVLSEESGIIEGDRELLAVVDPVDGSTNASRGIPWFNTSICVFDAVGPYIACVENHVTRERFEAHRGEGATRNGEPMPRRIGDVATGVVGVNGVPPANGPWAQFRTLGASALDLSYVASGALDGYVDFAENAHGLWDYAAALLICEEQGVRIVDAFARDLLHRDHDARRTPVAAHTDADLESLVSLRREATA